jgi:hypothetical protein
MRWCHSPRYHSDRTPRAGISAYAGHYTSQTYGPGAVIHDGSALRVEFGPNRYAEHSSTGRTIPPADLQDPDDALGLITFVISPSGDIVGFHGEDYRPWIYRIHGELRKFTKDGLR